MLKTAIIALMLPALAAPVLEVRPQPGLDFTLRNSPTPQKYLIETMPGGVALLDASDAVKEVLRQRDEVRRTPAPRGDGPTGTRPEHPVHHRRALGAPVGASPIPTA